MDLLDVGCGPASITADLAEFVAPGRVVALDASPSAIEAARATLAARGLLGGVELAVGDALALPFEDGAFDVVHAHQVLQHVEIPWRRSRKCAESSALAGRLRCATPYTPP